MQADKKKKESMSMWKIILIVNLAVYILSFVIPSGAYQRDGKMEFQAPMRWWKRRI